MEELLEALRNYHMCKTVHDIEMGKCEYSWGYHGWHYIKAVEKAEEQFLVALNKVIDERVQTILNSRLGPND